MARISSAPRRPADSVHNQVAELSDRVRKLSTLASVSRSLTSSLDSDQIIENIMRGAVTVIDAADSGLLNLYDEAAGTLVVRASVGFGDASFRLRQVPGEGISGKAFATGESVWYPDSGSARDAMSDLTDANRAAFREASSGLDYPRSALCVPLLSRGRPIGTMIVENLRSPYTFSQWDLEVLEAFAQQAAIALENSRLFESEHDSRVRFERVLGINEALTKLVLEDKGFEEIATCLAELLGKPVRITDPFLNVTAASASDLQAKPTGKLTREELGLSPAGRTPAHQTIGLATRESRGFLSFPITGAGELLGLVVVGPSEAEITEIDRAAAGHAAAAIGLALLKARAILEAETRLRGDLLDSLLAGDGHLPSYATALGLDPTATYGMLTVVNRPRGRPGHGIGIAVARASRIVVEAVRRANGLAADKGGSLIALRPLTAAEPNGAATEVRRWSEDLAAALARECPEVPSLIVAGEPCHELADLHRVRAEVTSVATLLERVGAEPGVYQTRDLGALYLLLQLPESAGSASFADRLLGPVDAYDRAHDARLIETLTSFVDNNRKLGPTARQLHVHPHTVQYRLQRATDLLELESRQYGWLNVELALRIRAMIRKPDLDK